MRIIFFFFFLCGFKCYGNVCNLDLQKKALSHHLIAVGYLDRHQSVGEKIGLGSYDYLYGLAIKLNSLIEDHLISLGYKFQESCSEDLFDVWTSKGHKIVLLNAHRECSSQSPLDEKRGLWERSYQRCHEQKKHSVKVRNFIEKHMLSFSSFAYVGHARYGSGLSFGNFNHEEAKLRFSQIPIYGETKTRLSRVFLGACNSVGLLPTVLRSQNKRSSGLFFFTDSSLPG